LSYPLLRGSLLSRVAVCEVGKRPEKKGGEGTTAFARQFLYLAYFGALRSGPGGKREKKTKKKKKGGGKKSAVSQFPSNLYSLLGITWEKQLGGREGKGKKEEYVVLVLYSLLSHRFGPTPSYRE